MDTQPPPSAKARIAFGKSQRNRLRRVDQGELRPKARGFDPIRILQTATANRLRHLLPLKYERMRASPFAFFRGAVSIMAADLGRLPHTGIIIQLCGDAHVQNLGSFAAPDGKLIFDVNDFDETIRGPWEWDVKRMVSSIVLAGRAAGQKAAACQAAVEAFLSGYLDSISAVAGLPILAAARHQIHRENRVRPVSEALRQSRRATPAELLKKLAVRDGRGRWRFTDDRPLHWRVRGEKAKEALSR